MTVKSQNKDTDIDGASITWSIESSIGNAWYNSVFGIITSYLSKLLRH